MKTRGVQDSQCNTLRLMNIPYSALPLFPFTVTALETASFGWILWECEIPTVYTISVSDGCVPGMDMAGGPRLKIEAYLYFL